MDALALPDASVFRRCIERPLKACDPRAVMKLQVRPPRAWRGGVAWRGVLWRGAGVGDATQARATRRSLGALFVPHMRAAERNLCMRAGHVDQRALCLKGCPIWP